MKHLLALLLCLCLLGCKSLPPDVIQEVQAVQQKAEELSKAGDATPKEQDLGLRLSDACWQILYRCGAVKDVPPDVRARAEDRKKAKEEADKSGESR